MAIQIGRIAGIPIALDWSLFVIFFLIVWAVGFSHMPMAYPGLGQLAYLSMGVLSALLLFASILIHELAHSVVAKRSGLRIKRITLYFLGGVSEMEEEPHDPSLELRMAAAGPMTSVALTVILGLLWELSISTKASPLLQAPLEYATLVNLIVAAFNLVPAFPMDGGRIFRSVLWRRNGDLLASTRTASTVGRGFGYLLIFGGIFLTFAVDLFTGFWFILIGWFISSGAQSSLRETIIEEDMRALKARDIMTRNVDSVPPDMTLNDLSQEIVNRKHIGFPVLFHEALYGCVTMDDLRKVRRDSWATTKVRDIMTPAQRLVTVKEDEKAIEALRSMNSNGIGRVFVTNQEGRLTGIITRSDILKTVRLREDMLDARVTSGASGNKISFSAERGMNFVLERPIDAGLSWSAEVASDGVQLVSEGVARTAEGHEAKQFTFRANHEGIHTIRLSEHSAFEGKEVQSRKHALRTVVYTIDVK